MDVADLPSVNYETYGEAKWRFCSHELEQSLQQQNSVLRISLVSLQATVN